MYIFTYVVSSVTFAPPGGTDDENGSPPHNTSSSSNSSIVKSLDDEFWGSSKEELYIPLNGAELESSPPDDDTEVNTGAIDLP